MSELRCTSKGRNLIKKWEGIEDGDPKTVNLDPYICPAGYATIGWGHVVLGHKGEMLKGASGLAIARSIYPNGISRDEAELLIAADLVRFENVVRSVARADCTQDQFDAMCALCFNIGPANFIGSSIARFHKAGMDPEAADAFLKWNKARVGGRLVELKGLTHRRQDERALYLGLTGP